MSQDITEEPMREPVTVVFMDPAATIVELTEDRDGLLLTLTDDDTQVHFRLPRTAAAGGLVRKLGWDIVNMVPDVRAQTLGYRAEHNAHTGPGIRGPIVRP